MFELFGQAIVVGLPVWIPIAFIAYAANRKRFSLKLFLVALTAEAIALAVAAPMIRWMLF
jgi:hypothetical protein